MSWAEGVPGWRRRLWVTERAAGSRGLWVGLEGRWVCTDEGRLHNATLSLLSLLSVLVGFGEGPECLKNFTRTAPNNHRIYLPYICAGPWLGQLCASLAVQCCAFCSLLESG